MYEPKEEFEKIAIHESKNSDKVIKFIPLTVESLSEYCSKKYARTIIHEHENGSVWGLYFTPSGKIKAMFI